MFALKEKNIKVPTEGFQSQVYSLYPISCFRDRLWYTSAPPRDPGMNAGDHGVKPQVYWQCLFF